MIANYTMLSRLFLLYNQIMDLYTKHAQDFSDTRKSPWKGWEKIGLKGDLQVLDLGCGNGRFLKYLVDNHINIKNYVGLDYSNLMLAIAKEESETFKVQSEFSKVDFNTNWTIDGKFNLVCAFGITHHLEKDFRRKFFENAVDKLETGGTFVVTFWKFMDDPREKNKILEDLGNNDYILSFGKDARRFCHYYTQEEIDNLIEGLPIEQVDTYLSDGKMNNLNKYLIFKRL